MSTTSEPTNRAPEHAAPTLYVGGSIYSPGEPFATAMLVADGVVAWLGGDGAARALASDDADVVELDGALITPAFVDAHVHVTATALADQGLGLASCRSVADVLAAVRSETERRRGDGVILGFGWDERQWDEPRAPTREELDRAAYGGAVFLDRADMHSSVVSSAMLAGLSELAGLPGFDPSGLLTDAAHHAARAAVAADVTGAQRIAGHRRVRAAAAAAGIGSLHEMAGPHLAGVDDLTALLDLADAEPGPSVLGYWASAQGVTQLPDARIAGLAGDLLADGTLGSRTAALRQPYVDSGDHPSAYLNAAGVREHVLACTAAGLQAGFHVIGDGALDVVLAGFEEAAAAVGPERIRAGNHRLEHVEFAHPEHIEVLATLGICASVQPAFDATWGGPQGMYASRLGERWDLLNPFAAMQKAGVALALGSDSPVTPFGPWEAIRAAAFHHNEAARISVRAAFSAHTRGGWRAAGRAGGILEVGAPATFAVWRETELVVQAPDHRVAGWSTDPRSGTPGLPDVSPGVELPVCARTVVSGEVVFDAGSLA